MRRHVKDCYQRQIGCSYAGTNVCPYWGTNGLTLLGDKWLVLIEGQMACPYRMGGKQVAHFGGQMDCPYWGSRGVLTGEQNGLSLLGDKWVALIGGQMCWPYWGTNGLTLLGDKWLVFIEGQVGCPYWGTNVLTLLTDCPSWLGDKITYCPNEIWVTQGCFPVNEAVKLKCLINLFHAVITNCEHCLPVKCSYKLNWFKIPMCQMWFIYTTSVVAERFSW